MGREINIFVNTDFDIMKNEHLLHCWPVVRGTLQSLVLVDSPYKGSVMQGFVILFVLAEKAV